MSNAKHTPGPWTVVSADGKYRGEFHDASMCTFDGRALWVASFVEGKHHILDVSEHATPEEARAWLHAWAKRRGIDLAAEGV